MRACKSEHIEANLLSVSNVRVERVQCVELSRSKWVHMILLAVVGSNAAFSTRLC